MKEVFHFLLRALLHLCAVLWCFTLVVAIVSLVAYFAYQNTDALLVFYISGALTFIGILAIIFSKKFRNAFPGLVGEILWFWP